MEIRQLPLNFGVNGYQYTQLRRTDTVALYTGVNNRGSTTYEVHKVPRYLFYAIVSIDSRLPFKPLLSAKFKGLNGVIKIVNYPDREILASNEEFGRFAWSYHTEPDAISKFEALIK